MIPVPAGRTVTVCMDGVSDPRIAQGMVPLAQSFASDIFARIGVAVQWRIGFRNCPEQALRVTVSLDTPRDLRPGALAYALPYEGTHIVVFQDRILRTVRQPAQGRLLGHVLAHEIAHILQGICRHSESGIMKPHWGPDDYAQMGRKPLAFTDTDVNLIQIGMSKRAAHATAATTAADSAEAELSQK
jgi:hypothetical protein